MSIIFYCDNCETRITVGDDQAGREMQCPCCEAGIVVQTDVPESLRAAPAAVVGDAALASDEETARCIFLFVGWAAIAIGLLIVLGGIIVIAHTPKSALTEGSYLLLYSWAITLLPGIATFLVGVLVLGILAWMKSAYSPTQGIDTAD